MHLDPSQTRALASVLQLLAEAENGDELRQRLALPMLELLRADTYTSMVWDAQSQRFRGMYAMNVAEDTLQVWDDHFRFIDPLTLPLMQRRVPTLANEVLMQRDLVRTEFFNDFLLRDRCYWGVNVYFFDGQEGLGDFRIWRYRHRGSFTQEDLGVLRLLSPAITSTLARLRWCTSAIRQASKWDCAEEQLQRVGGLSAREAQIAWLVSSGCPDKEISNRLGLERATVRFHISNAFRKMRAGNRVALAARVHALVRELEDM
ncbi:helix-turn-helix transcriptional regulator [Thiomonas sp. FB-6]|uniref:helix-turn-helix transcriptional regulator n=1 Tax=Thiomonas sp. FB-6 TaxID=1158291 RepID=UPI000360670E|nr:helix-turn-helix transcriptional regulator [Thiomonas sp. FB-6]